jgi:hypothetical protein
MIKGEIMATVYVVNKGQGHDFTAAKRFGDIVYLSEGIVPRFAVSKMMRMFFQILKDSKPSDMLLQTSLTTMNSVAVAIMVHLHKRVNILLYRDDGYVKRSISFEDITKEKEEEENE